MLMLFPINSFLRFINCYIPMLLQRGQSVDVNNDDVNNRENGNVHAPTKKRISIIGDGGL